MSEDWSNVPDDEPVVNNVQMMMPTPIQSQQRSNGQYERWSDYTVEVRGNVAKLQRMKAESLSWYTTDERIAPARQYSGVQAGKMRTNLRRLHLVPSLHFYRALDSCLV